MESASLIALFSAGAMGTARSAQPNAPQIIEKPNRISAAVLAARSRAATFLHRLAWAVEPDPR